MNKQKKKKHIANQNYASLIRQRSLEKKAIKKGQMKMAKIKGKARENAVLARNLIEKNGVDKNQVYAALGYSSVEVMERAISMVFGNGDTQELESAPIRENVRSSYGTRRSGPVVSERLRNSAPPFPCYLEPKGGAQVKSEAVSEGDAPRSFGEAAGESIRKVSRAIEESKAEEAAAEEKKEIIYPFKSKEDRRREYFAKKAFEEQMQKVGELANSSGMSCDEILVPAAPPEIGDEIRSERPVRREVPEDTVYLDNGMFRFSYAKDRDTLLLSEPGSVRHMYIRGDKLNALIIGLNYISGMRVEAIKNKEAAHD